jgi:hypothetical protein
MASQQEKKQTPFDDEISISDIAQFFKKNFKRIVAFIVIGGILGICFGKFIGQKYLGTAIISPAKVAGIPVVDTKNLLTQLNINSYFSRENFSACNPKFDDLKDENYDMSEIIQTSITKDESFIKINMHGTNKEIIHACLNSIANNIIEKQKIISEPLIESKKDELNYYEKELMLLQTSDKHRATKLIKNLETIQPSVSADKVYKNIDFNNENPFNTLIFINKIKYQLSSQQSNNGGLILPIDIQQKNFPWLQLGLLLGGCLSIFLSLLKK